ncbi:hypothetical protein D9Q98_001996 [Chlorella vulgaris]|uniref:Partial AB-hydrolase lipase domain-containing protein n=1 Tax=Chlorella vulgaris TaxID=3077 RepID=A0A9D4TVK4_CHLVU|nr:hypothetical protein D9Q98_001996 [Chlorella vulgaris]
MAARFQQLAGAAVWWVLIVCRWGHATFVALPMNFFLDTVLANYEEAVKSAVREAFSWTARFLNGVAARAVALFVDPEYYDTLRAGRRRPTAWQRWWAERARRGTFNAVLERDGLVVKRASPSPSPSPGAPVWTPRGTLPRSSGSYQLLYDQQQRQAEVLLAAERLEEAGGASTSAAPPVSSGRRWLRLLWPFGRWRAAGGGRGGGSSPAVTSPPRIRRSGSELFDRPSGYAAAEGMKRRGLLEEGRIGMELAVTAAFEALRSALRTILLLPAQPKWGAPGGSKGSAAFAYDASSQRHPHGGKGRPQRGLRQRLAGTRGFGMLEDLQVWTVSDCILQAGFPLEEHLVTTQDGCILRMQRIPRKGARDVVFFQHGVLDTSMGWVANGIQGSQAFAAWDQGHDVWLGNARSNPPRMHADPALRGSRYWHYTLGELGTQDIAAQVEHIHAVKMRELRPGTGYAQGSAGAERDAEEAAAGLRRSYSDSAVATAHLLRASPFGDGEGPAGSSVGAPSATGAAAASRQLNQHRSSEQAPPAPRRTTGILDGGPRALSSRRRLHQDSLGIQAPPAAAAVAPPAAAAAAGAASGQADLIAGIPAGTLTGGGRRVRIASPERQKRHEAEQQQLGSLPSGGRSPFMSKQPLPDSEQPLPDSRPGPGSSSSITSGTGGRLRSSSSGSRPPRPLDVSSSDSGAARLSSVLPAGIGSAAAASGSQECSGGWAAPSRLPSAPDAGAAGSPPPRSRLGIMHGPAPALTPDKISIAGVEQRGEAEASTSSLLLPTATHTPIGNSPRAPRPGTNMHGAVTAETYRLRAVGHSLGGASLLIYAVNCGLQGRPHHLRRLVLLTPAGFHTQYPIACEPALLVMPGLMAALSWLCPGRGAPMYLPSSLLRYITFKLTVDLHSIPGLNQLTRAAMRRMLSNDSSEWDRALQMPHYSTYSMPALSLHSGAHFVQLIRSRRFRLYDYGSAAANYAHYRQEEPPDIAANYHLLQGLPVDLVAGGSDGIIAEANVQEHYKRMREAGVQVTFKCFPRMGHLDMTFGVKEEVRRYVVSRLQLP